MNSHSEKKSTFPKSSKTAANQKANESTRNNFSLPILATGTNLVTLAQNNGFNWAPIVDNDHHDKSKKQHLFLRLSHPLDLARLNFGQPILCFPQTQAILPGIPLLNIRQSAEQSVCSPMLLSCSCPYMSHAGQLYENTFAGCRYSLRYYSRRSRSGRKSAEK